VDPIGVINDFLFPPRNRPRRSLDESAVDLVAQPADSTLRVVTTATLVFYAAEVGVNPKVNSVWDALVYCTTCLSVGYGDIFARTPIGKMVGSALMTIGPSLSGATLDGPHNDKVDDKVEREILSTLQEILRRMPPAPGSTTP
jgi:hypothetical protein